MENHNQRLHRFLLSFATFGLLFGIVFGIGWFLTLISKPPILALESLSLEDRQNLLQSVLRVHGNIYESAWFDPRIAYTLTRDASLQAWGDSFQSNELGYRVGPTEKPKDVQRVVFLGDSWTY